MATMLMLIQKNTMEMEMEMMNLRFILILLFLLLVTRPTNQELLDVAQPPSTDARCACEAPPSDDEASPSDFPNILQYNAYKVIQRFKRTITCDPNNVTATWVGYWPCTYTGFSCDTPPDRNNTPTISSVDFNGFHLCAPALSGFLDQLPDLAIFHANSNGFSGTLPNLTSLPFFYELDVSNNLLSGQFPTNLLALDQLLFLDIRYNSFAGSVPAGIFQLGLGVLFLNNNGFSQPLPASLGASPVAYLTLANNGFTGSIPASICNSSNTLIEVLFLNNRLSGCLPPEIGLLQKATVFDAGANHITGTIPLSFGCLKKVEQLNLAGNLLYGHVPSVVCKLAETGSLMNLSLSENYFTSVGISCWDLIENKVLDVSRNCIVGLPNQRSLLECARFLLKPKCCPLSAFIPCPLNHPDNSSDDVSPLPAPAAKLTTQASVTYNAIHNTHLK